MQANRIYQWDIPTRTFHWLLFVLVLLAIATALQGGNMMVWHGFIGQLILGLIVFRLAWGVVGSTYALIGDLVPGLGDIIRYRRGDWPGVGHHPMGALVSIALLAVLFVQAVLGLFANDDIAFRGPFSPLVSQETGEFLTGLHRQNLWLIVGLVAVHVLAVVYLAIARKEDLVRPMITGWKVVSDPEAKSAKGGGWIAVLMALFFAAIVVWMAAGGPMTVLAPPPTPVEAPW